MYTLSLPPSLPLSLSLSLFLSLSLSLSLLLSKTLYPEMAEKLDTFIKKLKACLDVSTPFTVVSIKIMQETSQNIIL